MQKQKLPLIDAGWLRALLLFFLLIISNGVLFVYFYQRFDQDESAATFPLWSALDLVQVTLVLSAVISISVVVIFCKWIDNRPLISLGFSRDQNGAYTGFFLAAVMLGSGSMILFWTGHVKWINYNNNLPELLSGLVLMFVVAFSEELAFRGYILSNLLTTFRRWPSILIAAVAFACMHAGNPGMQVIPVVNLLLAGILLGLGYVLTNHCWFPVFFHFGWNFIQGPVLGFQVSGLKLSSLLDQEVSRNDWLTGGAFGFEGSIVATILLLGGIIVLETQERMKNVKEKL